jgi:hypothetical protein
VAGKVGQPYTSAYCSSKFGIVGLSECLRQELMDLPDIHVCTILPASIDTPIFQHAANYTGRAVKPMSPVYDPEQVSDAIVRCIEHPVREIVVGGAGKRLLMVRSLLPAWSERQMASKVESDHFQRRRADPTAGNLFEPMPGLLSAHGGWKPPGINWASLATVGLAALGIGLFAWWLGASEDAEERDVRVLDR